MNTVYFLKSKVDGSYYVGMTSDLTNRLSEHSRGKTRS
ncbi:MAG TPA: GIY-YIG nuclease family protein, partial [bacterium]|nr:GIY-YIG nuclease family protein [bacterium]